MNIQDFKEFFVSIAICKFEDSFKYSFLKKSEVWHEDDFKAEGNITDREMVKPIACECYPKYHFFSF